jgi:polysaccharide export outer membrane protein
LDISVFDVPELAQTVRVSDLGDATLSLIGPRHLAGLTAVEAQELIAKDLKSGNLILDPQVTVLIREYGTQGISVLGEVHHPGNYPVLGSHNVLDIISLAGGITSLAGTQATVRRRGSKQLVNVNITNDAKSTLEGDIELQPGDTLMVPRTGIIYVVGQVGRPGGFPMQNNGAMSLLQAIALAEGTQSTADLKHTRIIRKTDSGFQEASISLDRILKGHSSDLALHADDVVFVPNSAAKRMGFRLESALQAAGGAAIYAVKP